MDHLSKERRSWNMCRIRSKDTTPELAVRSLLHRNGFRFMICCGKLPGKPDIVLRKHNEQGGSRYFRELLPFIRDMRLKAT